MPACLMTSALLCLLPAAPARAQDLPEPSASASGPADQAEQAVQSSETPTPEPKAPEAEQPGEAEQPSGLGVSVSYGDNGFELKTDNDLFSLSIQNRIQFRYANPFDTDPRSLDDLKRTESSFMIRRARTKFGGHAYWPWLKYTLQYDWNDEILRDLNLSLEHYDWARLFVGRGKVIYNDERMTSSGKQQFVNRSIVNDIFTVDRQDGIQLSGNLFPDSWYDLSYYAGVFTGLGVGERENDDREMMYAGRLQWNLLGGVMPFSQSDLDRHQQPALSLAVAGATNQSKCTAFTTTNDSCQALPGFEVGEAGQYRINQLMEELRFKWQGFSINHELHWKQVIDTLKPADDSARTTGLLGGLVQVGYFPHGLVPLIPKELELAGRYAFVDPKLGRDRDLQHEFSGAVTYFLRGHDNKLTLQLSHLIVEDPEANQSQAAQRLWLQWDVSF